MAKMALNTVLQFNKEISPHPDSTIVGIDSYDFSANDEKKRYWKSYTLVPVDKNDRVSPYDRWYVVDLPDLGLSFVAAVEESTLPSNLDIEPKLTGDAVVQTTGDGELGTGKSALWAWWDNNVTPPVMYAKETFADGDTLYFKTIPLVGLKT